MSTATTTEIEANRRLRVLADERRSSESPNPVGTRCTGGRVLADIGCGTGAFTKVMHDRYDTLFGIDFIPIPRSDLENVHFLRADLRVGIPLNDGVADTITAIEVIEHAADPILLVREAFRVAKPGAEFILTTPNIRYIRHLFRLVLQGKGPKTAGHHDDELLWDGGHVHYFTSRDLKALLKDAGFVSVQSMAMIQPDGFLPGMRSLLSRWPGNPLVREFLSGRLMVTGRKPEDASP